MSTQYDPEEEARLARRLAAGEEVRCPRCGGAMTRRTVPPRDDVSYVRDRLWLVCGGCGRSAVLDRRRVEREGSGPAGEGSAGNGP